MTEQFLNKYHQNISWKEVLEPSNTVPSENWAGPQPELKNIEIFIKEVYQLGHKALVKAVLTAAEQTLHLWEEALKKHKEYAKESLLGGAEPNVQLSLIKQWLHQSSKENLEAVDNSIAHSKQFYWFAEEYEESWGEDRFMWTITACEFAAFVVISEFEPKQNPCVEAFYALISSINAIKENIHELKESELAQIFNPIIESISNSSK